MPSSSALALALASALCAFAGDAHAFERQHHLGVAPAFGMLTINDKSTNSAGFGGAAHYVYGLTDAWNLTASASSIVVALDQEQDSPTSPRTRPSMVHQAAAGISYVVDILRITPWIGIEGGACILAGGTLANPLVLPEVSAALGADYQINRTFAVGFAGREHLLVSKLDTYPSYLTLMLRFEVMWGY